MMSARGGIHTNACQTQKLQARYRPLAFYNPSAGFSNSRIIYEK